MNKWQAIIFDLDDTLYPEREYVLSGFQAVADWLEREFSFPAEKTFAELRDLFISGVRGDTFDLWLEHHNLPTEHNIPQMIQVYRQHKPAITPFSIVPGLLARLENRYRLGLVSDGFLAVQQLKFGALNIAHHFDAVVFSDFLGRDAWKPSPKPFWFVVEKLGIQPYEAVYIADNPVKDFFGARQVGMKTVWCRESQGDYTRLMPPTTDYAPDISVEHLSDIESVLIATEKR